MKGKIAWICYTDDDEYPLIEIVFTEPEFYMYSKIKKIVYFEVE